MSESLTETFEPIIDRPMLNKYNAAVKVEYNTQPEDAWMQKSRTKYLKHNVVYK